jgi:hypothetical protein
MKKLVSVTAFLVVMAELSALFVEDRRYALWAPVAVVVGVLFSARLLISHRAEPVRAAAPDVLGDYLRSWLSRTETLIRWSESTRSDWDRHLRPMLAARFAISTGQKQAKDPAAFQATGLMLLGPQLWPWVDPHNVAETGQREPAPGRAALEEILERLEQL